MVSNRKAAETAPSEIENWVNHSGPIFISHSLNKRLQFLITIEHKKQRKRKKDKAVHSLHIRAEGLFVTCAVSLLLICTFLYAAHVL